MKNNPAKKGAEKKNAAKKGAKKGKGGGKDRLSRKRFEAELERLQIELCHLQEWVKDKGERIVVVFEGRDAAGKGGVIKRITERVSPRVFRVEALPAPTEREQSQLYMQRYIARLPAAGEIVLFDRSWYNRGGVERVMGFCTEAEYRRFLRTIPDIEHRVVDDGIRLVKYFFDVSRDEQEKRFLKRASDPLRHWKLSPMDVESWRRWWDYTAAYGRMLDATDTAWAPWYRVPADDKRRARLNCISHLLSVVPYEPMKFDAPKLTKRKKRRASTPKELHFRREVPAVF